MALPPEPGVSALPSQGIPPPQGNPSASALMQPPDSPPLPPTLHVPSDPSVVSTLPTTLSAKERVATAQANVSNATKAWNDYLASNPVQVTGNKVMKTGSKGGDPVKVQQAQAALNALGSPGDPGYDPDTAAALQSQIDKYSGTDASVVDPVGQALFNAAMAAGDLLTQEVKDAKNAGLSLTGGGGGAQVDTASAYLAAEQNKTAEDTRQFKDFAARADELQQLQAAEQKYAIDAAAANASVAKGERAGLTNPGEDPYFIGSQPRGLSLSDLLAPSIPANVLPDYQLNGAVGLPGQDGFAPTALGNPQVQAYAHGTPPEGRHPSLGPEPPPEYMAQNVPLFLAGQKYPGQPIPSWKQPHEYMAGVR